jgi:hypothetical protein
VRLTVSAVALLGGGLPLTVVLTAGLAGTAVAAGAARPAAATAAAALAGGSPQACTAYAYAAISRHQLITATPAPCQGLSRAQVSQAAGTAIRMSETGRSKSERRRQAVAAGRWLPALITDPGPAASASPGAAVPAGQAAPAGPAGAGLGLGGVSEPAATAGALLAWLATAASGGWVLARWLLAGGSLARKTATAAPAPVILGHAGAGALGLVLWASFTLSGWAPLAWSAVGLLAPVAGLGLGVLLLGLPRPARPGAGRRRPGRRTRVPAVTIAAHGLFAVTALLLTLMAAIGAG